VPHADISSETANAAAPRSADPISPPPLFQRADTAPLAAHSPRNGDLCTALSEGLCPSLSAAVHAASGASPRPHQPQQHQIAGHVRMNPQPPTQMFPTGDAVGGHTHVQHSSCTDSFSSQLAQLRDATIRSTASASQHQQKRRLSSGHVHGLHARLPTQSMVLPHHEPLALPQFDLGPDSPRVGQAVGSGGSAAVVHHMPSRLLSARAPQPLQSHPLSPQQEDPDRCHVSGHMQF
jgi:hypothetical protein